MGKNKFLKNLNLAIHITRDAKKDDDVQWITKKGHHLAVNGEGEIVAGGIPNTNIGKGTKLNGSSTKEKVKGKKKKGKQKADESNVENLLYKLNVDEIYFNLLPALREMGNKKLGKGIDYNEDSRNYMVEQIMDDIKQWKYGTLKDVVNAYNKTFIKEEEGGSQVKDSIPGGTQMVNAKYDPILCMNVPAKGTKAQDAAGRNPQNPFDEIVKEAYSKMSIIYHNSNKAKSADEISDLSEELEKTYKKYLDMTLDVSNAISKMQRDARNRIRDLFEANNKDMFNLYQSHKSKTGKTRG